MRLPLSLRCVGLVLFLVSACSNDPRPVPDTRSSSVSNPISSARAPNATAASTSSTPGKTIVFVPAAPGDDVATIVRGEMEQAGDARVLVYVGATWCEPCRRFHDAATAGELDRTLPKIRFVEFDLDRDGERLQRAGYRSKLIPLFALPALDGASSGKKIEGSIKGPGAVAEISPRLIQLLSSNP